MMIHRTWFAVALTIGAVASSVATATAADGTDLEKLTTKLTYLLNGQPFAKPDWTSTMQDLAKLDPPSACFAAVKASGPGTKVYSSQAFWFPAAQKDDQGTYVTLAEVSELCARYERTYVVEYAEAALVEAFLEQAQMKRAVEGQHEGEAKRVGEIGAACAARVDAALAFGLAASTTVESSRYHLPAIELGAAKATYCQPAIDFAAQRVGQIKDLAQAKQDAIIAVYKQAGIKGRRLELYVSYGMPDNTGFYAAGCASSVTSLAALKKAKKLFVWLEGSDGYTVRKFTFSGDNYKVSEKTYGTQEGAYRGCR